MFNIIVTPGEKAIIDEFNKRNVNILIENLLVGDIHIRDNDNTLYIFERKAKGDLEASIKDGRYHEQKNRLIETGLPRKQIIYIIEQLIKPKAGQQYTRIWSSICHSIHRDGFGVFCTKNIEETIDYLIGMLNAVNKFPIYSSETIIEKDTFVNIGIKKKNVQCNEWLMYCLSLIPNVSIETAKVIVEKFPSFKQLEKEFTDKGDLFLADLKHGASQRRLGDKLSEKIALFIKDF